MSAKKTIKPRDRDAILQSLRAGVVPARGQQHIQVGRAGEVQALVQDIERIAGGGAAFRLVVGAFGSGKTFFLQLVRTIALEKKLVTVHADLNPDRRLQSTQGHARSLFSELMRNMATRSKPDGGALGAVVEKFVTTTLQQAQRSGEKVNAVLQTRLHDLSDHVGGFDFAQVIEAYWRGHDLGDENLKADAIRWLRAEYTAKTDARRALGVRRIIDDASFYDQLKLLGDFVRMAGFEGLLINLDEMVNLYKMANTKSRNSNFEQILRILNDVLQGTAEGLGFILGGTPEFLSDTRRGLFSYEALQTRLAENPFATDGITDFSGPVIRLGSLTPEDLFVLLSNIRNVFAAGDPAAHLVPDEALTAFLQHCSERVGEAYFRTPRNTIKEFVALLSILDQNEDKGWRELLGGIDVAQDSDPHAESGAFTSSDEASDSSPSLLSKPVAEDDDDLSSFSL